MPKFIFYTGTAFCLFLALTCAAVALGDAGSGHASFVGIGDLHAPVTARAGWAIVVGLLASIAAAAIFIRMAALVAARNLFAAFVAFFSVVASVTTVVWILMLQSRMLILMRSGAAEALRPMAEMHLAAALMLGYFVALMMLALRPYFRIQASRILSLLVFLPLPLMLLIVAQELFVRASVPPLPASSPALIVYFGVLSVLFFSISLHCVRHRYLFLEMTNLRELLDSRVDPAAGAPRRAIGGVAFDS